MGKKDEGVKIPMLDKEHYFHWKVKMRMHLLSFDTSYINCIEKGPHVPMKISTEVRANGEDLVDSYVPKSVSEYTEEDEKEVHKDKKVMNILFNGVDSDMFDNVINCTTAKDVWDTIQTLCEGTEQVRENKMQLFVQTYEHFHYKAGESLNDVFSRFQKLLNALKLYGRVYLVKDSNLKFLRSLPKDWKPMTVALRQAHDFNEYSLDKLYGILKTYELEIQQDEEMEKSSKKEKSVALVAEKSDEKDEPVKNVSANITPSKKSGEGKAEGHKGKSKMVMENEDDSTDEELNDIDEHLAFLARKFSKLKFKKNASSARPFRKSNQPRSSNLVDRSNFKCFNCGLAGHFSSECRKPRAEKEKSSSENADYKKKYFDLLNQKGRAFISEEKDWAAGDDSDDEQLVNLALMALGDESESPTSNNGQVSTTNTSELSKIECKQIIDDMSNEIYNLRTSLKSLTKESLRIKKTNELLTERNNFLESELLQLETFKKESRVAKDELVVALKEKEIFKKQLEREQEIMARWKNSRDVVSNMHATKIIEEKCISDWSSIKEELEKEGDQGSAADQSTDNDHQLKNSSSTDENYQLRSQKLAKKKNSLDKLNEQYGPTNKNFVKEESSSNKPVKEVNIGHLSNKQLKDKLDSVENKSIKKKSTRNGKVGINKKNNYTPDKNAVRKTCSKCGSENHLASNCKSILSNSTMPIPVQSASMPFMPMFQNSSAQYASMPFIPNLYFNAFAMPSMHMPQMTCQMPMMNAAYMNNMSLNNVVDDMPKNSGQSSKVKKDATPTKPKEESVSKPKADTNKKGPKTAWVPKSN